MLSDVKDSPYTDKVWTMWLQDDMPDICKICIGSIKKFYPDVVLISENNLKDYIDIPDYIYNMYNSGKMRACHFLDYVRMCLLDKYGETWIDATCFLTQKIPQHILDSDFCILHDPFKKDVSNYFIHSSAGNYLVKCLRIFLEQYWKVTPKAIGYFFFHKFLKFISDFDKKSFAIYNSMPLCFNLNTKLMHIVINKRFDKDLFDWLCQTSFLHKLTYKHVESQSNPNSLYNYLIENYK